MAINPLNMGAIDTALAELTADLSATASTALDISKLTEVKLDGSGVLDKILASCALVAEAEFNADRIRGTDYARFYLEIVQAALGNATQFLLAWDKAALEKANMLAQLKVNLHQAALLEAQIATQEKQTLDLISSTAVRDAQSANDTALKQQQVRQSEATVNVGNTQSANDTQVKQQQVLLTKAQTNLYVQKVVTEMAETNTNIPASVSSGADLTSIVPLSSSKVAGSKGANRDVSLEQRAGYMRKAQNDLIKVATGHVDMLVSSGAATNVGTYTTELLALLQKGSSTGNFTASSLLAKAVADASSLSPSNADSQ